MVVKWQPFSITWASVTEAMSLLAYVLKNENRSLPHKFLVTLRKETPYQTLINFILFIALIIFDIILFICSWCISSQWNLSSMREEPLSVFGISISFQYHLAITTIAYDTV